MTDSDIQRELTAIHVACTITISHETKAKYSTDCEYPKTERSNFLEIQIDTL
jgi:hypothetical protein